MSQIGGNRAVVDTTNFGEDNLPNPVKAKPHTNLSGIAAFFMWRGYYWSCPQVSWSNKMLIPMYWFKSLIFGRDISRF